MNPREASINFVAVAIASLVVSTGVLAIWNGTVFKQEIDTRDAEIAQLRTQMNDVIAGSQDSDVLDPADTKGLPVVSFVPESAFSEQQRIEINRKLIEPYLAFYNERELKVASLTVLEQTGTWRVLAASVSDNTADFTFGNPSSTLQDWWRPECGSSCAFSNTFIARYPEIALEQ